jgi:hypothetical protein
MTVSFPTVIRDDRGEAERTLRAQLAHNGLTEMPDTPLALGSPAEIADLVRPYRDLGFATMIARMPAPFDRETVARIGEVREHLGDG